jgi:type IV secretion system protein VirB10
MSAAQEESVREAGKLKADDDRAVGQEELLEPNAEGPGGTHAVKGERGIPSVNRARSLQSRLSNMLAITLMLALGVGLLTWYYARVLTHPAKAAASAQRLIREKAQGSMALPALGPISQPLIRVAPPAATAAPANETTKMTALQAILGPPPAWAASPAGAAVAPAAASAATPGERAFDRRLSGPAFASASNETSPGGGSTGSEGGAAGSFTNTAGALASSPFSPQGMSGATGGQAATRGGTGLSSLLTPQVMPAVEARVLPTQRFLLPKGASIDCTLETAIDSTLPGMTTCVTATDTLSADGTVVLLSRGTKLVGETRGEVAQGQSRIFVLWSEARTPSGVVVPLDSPGTDALGRSGLTGKVERHFWERFGAAILVSVIDGAVTAGAESTSKGGTVLINPMGSQDILTDVLQGSVNIPPTIIVPQGARIQILVARDVDFRSVYRLVPVSAGVQGAAP